jgi:hypothetical protein
MSDPAYSALDGHLMGVLKDGMEMLQSAMHVGEGKPFYGSPSLGDVNRVGGSLVTLSMRIGGRG